ncbi:MAG TPA: hypothetical protein VMN35_01310 [Gaiellaceae bacterium]|nr:hypothetical protein [Gaiellaceae bacterium]
MQLWDAGELSLGRAVELEGRRYLVRGVDPPGNGACRVYLEDLGSGRHHALVVERSRESTGRGGYESRRGGR